MSAPRDPEAAHLLGTLYKHIGGEFVILADGTRKITCDLDAAPADVPLRVGIMLEHMLNRLHPSDKDWLFDSLGEVAFSNDAFPAVAEPTRRAA